MSFTFHPDSMRMRTPGQVPRLDPVLDRTLELPPVYHLDKDIAAGVPARPIVRANAVASDLGLPRGTELTLTGLMKTLSAGTVNEIDFRRGVMTHLIAERYEPALRRAILSRALSFFRSTRPSSSTTIATQVLRPSAIQGARTDGRYSMKAVAPIHEGDRKSQELEKRSARGGKYHRRVPSADGKYKYVYDESAYKRMPEAHLEGRAAKDEYLRSAVTRILDRGGVDGCEPSLFSELVQKHGAKTIAGVLTAVGAAHVDGRVRRSVSKSATRCLVSAHVACFGIEYEEALWKAAAFGLLPLALADGARGSTELSKAVPGSSVGGAGSVGGGGGGAPSPKKLPPGTRRIWHNRIVERGTDEKWHVVGHVAGLEDPGKVKLEPLAPHEIDPEHLKEMIAKIKELLGHEKKKQDLIHSPIPGSEPKPKEQEQEPEPKAKPNGKSASSPKTEPKSQEPKGK
jgi:hypothetical protein